MSTKPGALQDQFILEIMDRDEKLASYLQRAAGYSLTGLTDEQCVQILFGDGENGKTTFVERLHEVVGDYALSSPMETFLVKKFGHGIPNDVARLKGARLVVASEAEDNERLAESRIKEMTGGDMISARFMRADWFDFRPVCKIWLLTNHKPEVRGADHAIWRRIRLVPFNVTFSGDMRDPKLRDALQAEGPGILAWMVRGCLQWQERGLDPPEGVLAATEEYRQEMDHVGNFIDERCVVMEHEWATIEALYDAYCRWCKKRSQQPLSKIELGKRLQRRGFPPERGTAGKRVRRGIGLAPEPDALWSFE